MAKFSEGFLRGLRGSGQTGSPTDPALQRNDPYGSSNPLAKSVGGMFGMNMQTSPELANREMRDIDQTAPDALMQSLAVAAKYATDPSKKMVILTKMSELKAAADKKTAAANILQKQREALKARAVELGLPELQEEIDIAQEDDISEISKELRQVERENLIRTQGAPARRAILKSVGIDDEDTIKSALKMSSDEFQELIDGTDADVKFFQLPPTPGNPKPEVVALKVNKAGNVLDEKTSKWVTPSSLNLSQAPQVIRTFNEANSIMEAVGGVVTEAIETTFANGAQAQTSYDIANDGLELIRQGIITGAGADAIVGAAKMAKLLSGNTFESADAVRTEQFVTNQLKEVVRFVKNFGSGAGITEKDVENATKGVGGSATMSEGAIVYLLEMSQEIATGMIKKRDKLTDDLVANGLDPVFRTVLETVGGSDRAKKPEETPNAPAYNANTLELLRKAGIR